MNTIFKILLLSSGVLLIGCSSENPKPSDSTKFEGVFSLSGAEIAKAVRPRRGVVREDSLDYASGVPFTPEGDREDGYLAFQVPADVTKTILGKEISFSVTGRALTPTCKTIIRFHTLTKGGTEEFEINLQDSSETISVDTLLVPIGGPEVEEGEIRFSLPASDCGGLLLQKITLNRKI